MHADRGYVGCFGCEAGKVARQAFVAGVVLLFCSLMCQGQQSSSAPAAKNGVSAPATKAGTGARTREKRGTAGSPAPTAQSANPQSEDQNPCKVVANKENLHFGTSQYATLDDEIVVIVQDLRRCLADKKLAKNGNTLRLMIDGKTLNSVVEVPNLDESYVKFFFHIDSHSAADPRQRENWAEIVRATRQSQGTGVALTVTDPDKGEVFPSDQRIVLNLYPSYTKWVVVGMAIVLVVLLVLGAKSNLLRDNPNPGNSAGIKLPVSLGRVQMAWWFYLVVSGYLYIWLITGNSYTPTGSVLALIGISGATGLASAVVDRSKSEDAASKRSQLAIQQTALQSRIDDIGAANPAAGSELAKELGAKKDNLANVNAELAGTPAPTVSSSKGWLRDLFCDGDGVSFHRFQMIIWTIVLGVVFVQAVHRQLAMPDFDPALLGLMGLSSGTYLGFKFPEKQK